MSSPAQARNRIRVMRGGEHFPSGIQAGGESGLLPGTGYVGLLLPGGEVIPAICPPPTVGFRLSDHPR